MNEAIFYYLYGLAHRYEWLDWLTVFFAEIFPYVVIMLAGLFLLFHHEVLRAENPYRVFLEKKKEILLAFFSGALAWGLAYVLKFLLEMPRPIDSLMGIQTLFGKEGYAFPSGHATFFTALAFSIFFQHKKAGYIFLLFALLIGLARVVAGVHFPIDILGGFALGGLIAYFVKRV